MKKVIIALALVLSVSTIFAQDNQEDKRASRQRFTNFETNRFIDNWEISVGAGVQTLYNLPTKKHGVKTNQEGFFKDASFAFDAHIQKWITPIFGFRAGFIGLGFTDYLNCGLPEGVKNEADYFDIHADVMINLTNWICHYKADRFYNAIVTIGAGWGRASYDEGDVNNEVMIPIGFINRFRICDRLFINLELRDQLVRNAFGGDQPAVSGRYLSNMLSATAGLTWAFSPKTTFNSYVPIDKAAYDNKISGLESDLQNAQNQNEEYQKQIAKYKKQLSDKEKQLQDALAKAAQEAPQTGISDVTMSVFFTIGSAKISDKNQVNIKFLADAIKSTNKSFTVTGYADNQTGSEERNLELSQQRAEAVCNALIEAGVSKDQIKVDYKGCALQPFDKSYLNRVAIIK